MTNWTQSDIDRVNAKISPKEQKKPMRKKELPEKGEKPVKGKRSGNTGKITDYSQYTIVVGIDTGVNTGFCAWDMEDKKILELTTYMIHDAIIKVDTLKNRGYKLFIRVEDARLATHGRNTKADKYKAQGAGSVKRDAKIWEDFLVSNNIPHEMVRPAMRKNKITSSEFKQITKWPKRTNQHSRDAGMLVFGL